jgi:atypical dual specificity phosphatase
VKRLSLKNATARPIARPGDEVTKIWERLYLGDLKDARQLARSNPQRIHTVISLCREESVSQAPKITYIHIPIPDSRPISAQKFEDLMFAIAIGVRRGNLLVHCLAGKSRSPILIAAYLNRCGYAGMDKALAEIAQLREIAPSQVLLRNVKQLSAK